MSTRTKTLAKSLHTVSVIVNVARHEMNTNPRQPDADWAVRIALNVLGYADAADPYGLAATALKQLEKEAANGKT